MSARGLMIFAGVSVVGLGVAIALDNWAAGALAVEGAGKEDWGRALRVCGYVPTWIVVGIAMVLIDARRRRAGMGIVGTSALARGMGVVLGALTGGAAAEVLKLIVRRLRPDTEQLGYAFRAFDDGMFDSGGLGFPSSHTAVAFGAAWALCRMHPEARIVWIALGAGCGATRLMAQAHWLSDVVGAAVVSYAVVWGLARIGLVPGARGREDALR